MEQSLYWTQLFQLKVWHRYTECYLAHAEKWDRGINIFSALCASSSIGAWVIWKDAAMLWAVVIAGSQVLQVVKPYLPYHDRIKRLATLRNSMAELFVFADTKWPSVASGELKVREIARLREEIRNRQLQYERTAFPAAGLPENGKYLELATEYAEKYFNSFYGTQNGDKSPAPTSTAAESVS